ncbi:uncharacterized protein AMSG_06709 [Thecamonas trahens ATCC 50062]|uniref:Cap-specific mRNA (nucleoside-2'-O-)-methyltransferase n=1 Tax=Thecamonas trahens ATCC 50062 TaxID=461836 RepID=A0A0L0DEQ0_THETB|nr:hypothetical protein AMSG_06709 [Thecamonas trahens ATCC 50062]KNC50807.1 hypothetical protein AMSG_06709 [Thecamonas trahens ATCC 50062]|eukprot:XP_013756763.1 hypothetical protein AMSG_06709 [Thecamonas trahens ATCC 50062]
MRDSSRLNAYQSAESFEGDAARLGLSVPPADPHAPLTYVTASARAAGWASNYHLRQGKEMYARRMPMRGLESLDRILAPDAPREAYRRRNKSYKTVNHWGQRKLLMSEVEFLTLYARPGDVVVYAGAAPGAHTAWLADQFPALSFELYDPADFVPGLGDHPRIGVHQEFFTDEICATYAGRDNVLFVSDIRTADWKVMGEEEVEKSVYEDQLRQQGWHDAIRPRYSMLKFRLPWGAGSTQYLDGAIHLPVWGPITTTETRLVVARDAPKVDWDHKDYEERMFYFNTVTRVHYYDHPVRVPGICHCYDCASEVIILREHIAARYPSLTYAQVMARVTSLLPEISKQISKGRNLTTIVGDPSQRNPWFTARRFDVVNKRIVNDPRSARALVQEKKARESNDGHRRPIDAILSDLGGTALSTSPLKRSRDDYESGSAPTSRFDRGGESGNDDDDDDDGDDAAAAAAAAAAATAADDDDDDDARPAKRAKGLTAT